MPDLVQNIASGVWVDARGNGGLIGTTTAVTSAGASGMFSLKELYNYRRRNTWGAYALPTVAYIGGTAPLTCVAGGSCAGSGGICYGATFTFYGVTGIVGSVNGTTLDYYVNGTYVGSRSTRISNFTTLGEYCTGTTNTAYVVDSFQQQSNVITFTSPTYV